MLRHHSLVYFALRSSSAESGVLFFFLPLNVGFKLHHIFFPFFGFEFCIFTLMSTTTTTMSFVVFIACGTSGSYCGSSFTFWALMHRFWAHINGESTPSVFLFFVPIIACPGVFINYPGCPPPFLVWLPMLMWLQWLVLLLTNLFAPFPVMLFMWWNIHLFLSMISVCCTSSCFFFSSLFHCIVTLSLQRCLIPFLFVLKVCSMYSQQKGLSLHVCSCHCNSSTVRKCCPHIETFCTLASHCMQQHCT